MGREEIDLLRNHGHNNGSTGGDGDGNGEGDGEVHQSVEEISRIVKEAMDCGCDEEDDARDNLLMHEEMDFDADMEDF